MKKRVYHVLFLCAVCFTESSYSVSRFSQDAQQRMDRELRPPFGYTVVTVSIRSLLTEIDELSLQRGKLEEQQNEIFQELESLEKSANEEWKRIQMIGYKYDDAKADVHKDDEKKSALIKKKYASEIENIDNELKKRKNQDEKESQLKKHFTNLSRDPVARLVMRKEKQNLLNEKNIENMTDFELQKKLEELKNSMQKESEDLASTTRNQINAISNREKEEKDEAEKRYYNTVGKCNQVRYKFTEKEEEIKDVGDKLRDLNEQIEELERESEEYLEKNKTEERRRGREERKEEE